ncbi:phosphoglycerate mutase family protein [Primorskyibacter aestuariivivens]|uniref:SixA phosphatase family protein n=1 Tax=Primorskyibacter aestuariivivens TaxID=1888912 RepID=UPI0023000365|nr:phosphoglycerate mutase family protein [Primorskyibacter aestuariivivens]MDA7427154.1 phosphoglycerate mutase family protein [Primorskyibacter aestuariivivens]
MKTLFLSALLTCVLALPGGAQEAVFLIRHAEKEMGDDPALTEAGRIRATRWALMLEQAGINAVITTDARRTQETGGIIAEALDLPMGEIDRRDIAGLIDLMSFDHEEDRVLVVAHRETIPSILSALGLFDAVSIAEDDFANLFTVTGLATDAPVLVHQRMP